MPYPITVGSLVRHKQSGLVALVTEHFMWSEQYGGFTLKFVKPWVREIGRPLLEVNCAAYDVEPLTTS